MWKVENEFKVIIGGNIFTDQPNLVTYKGESLFGIKRSDNDGLLGIDFDIFNKKGERAATVRNGVIVQGNMSEYTINTGMDRYTLTENKTNRIICDIKKRSAAEHAELEVSVKMFLPNGFLFDATPNGTNLPGGNQIIGCTFRNNRGGGIAIT